MKCAKRPLWQTRVNWYTVPMHSRYGIVAATAAALVLTGGLLAGCVQDTAPVPDDESSKPSFASAPADIDDRAEKEHYQKEQERLKQEREAAWRARFPLDDYSNTLIIGDSLMQNASASLYAAMPGVAVNADAGRTLETGGKVIDFESPDAGVLDIVRNDGGFYERYVIETGNNDGGGLYLEAAQEIVDCLGPEKEIYFVTMCSVPSPDATATTNSSIDAMVAEHANVHKIDWYGLVHGHEGDYLSDGVHAYRSRESDYAAFIKEGLDVVY